MVKYVVKRLLLVIPVILAVTFIVFFIMGQTTSSPGEMAMGPMASKEDIEAFNESVGYYDPLLVQFFNYVKNIVLHGDMGTSYFYKAPVKDMVFGCLGITVGRAFMCIVFALVLGVVTGVIAAVKQYTFIERATTVAALFVAAVPSFCMAMVLIYAFALKLHWLPAFGVDSFACHILPTISLGLPYASRIMRQQRSSMLDCIRQDYIDTAKSKGLPRRRVIWKHAFNNAVLTVITSAGQVFGALIGGVVINEQIFGVSGLGTLVSTAIKNRDIPIVCGSIVVMSTSFCLIMLLVDLIHAAIDPRIRARYSSGG